MEIAYREAYQSLKGRQADLVCASSAAALCTSGGLFTLVCAAGAAGEAEAGVPGGEGRADAPHFVRKQSAFCKPRIYSASKLRVNPRSVFCTQQ